MKWRKGTRGFWRRFGDYRATVWEADDGSWNWRVEEAFESDYATYGRRRLELEAKTMAIRTISELRRVAMGGPIRQIGNWRG